MGHRISKHRQGGTGIFPSGNFSVSEDTLPQHSTYNTSPESGISMEMPVDGMRRTLDVQDLRQDSRRHSIYSTTDAMPDLEFYANATATGRIRRSRPSLETLRMAFDNREYGSNISESGAASLSAMDDMGNGSDERGAEKSTYQPVRFGWVTGVLVRHMTKLAYQAQILFFLVLMVSFINYFVGTVIPATPKKQSMGIFSYRRACVVRDASGNMNDSLPLNFTEDCYGLACSLGWNFTKCEQSLDCSYGLANNFQACGLGKLKPNVLVMGFKTNWQKSPPHEIDDYIKTIYDSFDSNHGVCVLRMMDGLDIRDELLTEVNLTFEADEGIDSEKQNSDTNSDIDNTKNIANDQIKTVFQTTQGKKTIDIYWISDDGGLTLLVPYLLTRRKCWRRSKVRVFITGKHQTMEKDRKDIRRFEDTITPFTVSEGHVDEEIPQQQIKACPWKVTDKEIIALRLKSERKVRLNEIIRRNSKHAALVLVSLPVPQSDCPSSLYMAWLETLSWRLHCPVLLIRGNQQNVMTFYCQ
ncbi:Solute carrier family 12 member 3 [Triplophysa tibetana]|uniref:Solute carrier family 12 member 3 n=1 Tax=Triplophysa tibetana TaxID=1572043 RepID=A0A5A9PMG9_9TELE|nr:Solute carrier family 12 member 3 [Triplophysa tibetana]